MVIKNFLVLALMVISASSFAIDTSITKTASPNVVVVTNGGAGLAQFGLLSADFPTGTSLRTKTLLGIDWRTTLYPNHPAEIVRLCYFRPYSASPIACHQLASNTSGTDSGFNNQPFGPGARVVVEHWTNGGPQPAYPAGQDTVTIRYRY